MPSMGFGMHYRKTGNHFVRIITGKIEMAAPGPVLTHDILYEKIEIPLA